MRNRLRATADRQIEQWRLRVASFARLNANAHPGDNPRLAAFYRNSGLCFVHIPKNGGTTVENVVYGEHLGHRSWDELYRLAPLDYACWLKFCVIRDPIERFLSAYDYLRRGGRNAIDREIGRRFVSRLSPDEVAQRLYEKPGYRSQALRYFHFRPQADYVLSDDGLCMVDRLIRFDRLSEELSELLSIAPMRIGHRNRTAGRRTSPGMLETASRSMLETLYARDVALHATAQTQKRGQALYLTRIVDAVHEQRVSQPGRSVMNAG